MSSPDFATKDQKELTNEFLQYCKIFGSKKVESNLDRIQSICCCFSS